MQVAEPLAGGGGGGMELRRRRGNGAREWQPGTPAAMRRAGKITRGDAPAVGHMPREANFTLFSLNQALFWGLLSGILSQFPTGALQGGANGKEAYCQLM